ncbi:MAG: PspC domain-containing protein [Acidobacteria bacterium]|nr:PspC domain-containing protein [Acidobacteriota bacterium]
MTCYNCQKEIQEGSRYCYHCGAAQKPLTPPRPARPLRRSRANKVVAGVCGGLAEYFELDAVLVRLVWALVTLFSGIVGGAIAYVICWIVIPYREEESAYPVPASR